MNIPKTFESAMIDALRKFDVGADTTIRSWRNLQKDEKWNEEEDRTFPCIDVRATPPRQDPNVPCAFTCDLQMQIFTKCADDLNHFELNRIELAVQECIDTMYGEFRNSATSGTFIDFQTTITTDCAVSIGGIMIGEPLPPDEDGEGRNYVGLTLIVSYSRDDLN